MKYIQVDRDTEHNFDELLCEIDYDFMYDWNNHIQAELGYVEELETMVANYESEFSSKSDFIGCLRRFFATYNVYTIDIYTHSGSCMRGYREIQLPARFNADNYLGFIESMLEENIVISKKKDKGAIDWFNKVYNCTETGQVYYVCLMEEKTCECCLNATSEQLDSISGIMSEDIQEDVKDLVKEHFGHEESKLDIRYEEGIIC